MVHRKILVCALVLTVFGLQFITVEMSAQTFRGGINGSVTDSNQCHRTQRRHFFMPAVHAAVFQQVSELRCDQRGAIRGDFKLQLASNNSPIESMARPDGAVLVRLGA
jgi:hypothetical protein